MQILDILNAAQGGNAIAGLGAAFGLDPKAAEAAVGALVPQLTRAMERNTLSRGGLADLLDLLAQGGRQGYLDSPKALGSPEVQADGIGILEQVLGSKDQSRKLAERAARETGLSETVLKSMLPAVAAMVIGGLAKGAGGALGDLVAQISGLPGSPLPLPGEPARRRGSSGDLGGEARRQPPTGRLDDGAPRRRATEDVPMPRPHPPSGGGTGHSPLPIPGDDLPGLGRGRGATDGSGRSPLDDLSDILRRSGLPGGSRRIELPRQPGGDRTEMPDGAGMPGPVPAGGTLWSIVRSVLGSVLGFESKGFLGWLVRLIVLRWGWGLLKRILTRALTGR